MSKTGMREAFPVLRRMLSVLFLVSGPPLGTQAARQTEITSTRPTNRILEAPVRSRKNARPSQLSTGPPSDCQQTARRDLSAVCKADGRAARKFSPATCLIFQQGFIFPLTSPR